MIWIIVTLIIVALLVTTLHFWGMMRRGSSQNQAEDEDLGWRFTATRPQADEGSTDDLRNHFQPLLERFRGLIPTGVRIITESEFAGSTLVSGSEDLCQDL